MGVRLHLFLDGKEQLDFTLARFEDKAQDYRPAFNEIADSFEEWMQQQFESEGAYSTGRWSPLSPDYGKWKARHFPGRKILEQTGGLKLGLTRQPFNIDIREPKMMILGTSDPKGRWHHDGAGNLPKRTIMKMPSSIRVQWRKIIQHHLVRNTEL